MRRDSKNNIGFQIAINETLSGTGAGTSAVIDTYGFNTITAIVSTATVTDAGGAAGIIWELQESDVTGSGYTAVADADLIGVESDLSITVDTQDNVVIGRLGYVGNKRFLKLIPTGSTGTDAAVLAHFVLGMPNNAPVA